MEFDLARNGVSLFSWYKLFVAAFTVFCSVTKLELRTTYLTTRWSNNNKKWRKIWAMWLHYCVADNWGVGSIRCYCETWLSTKQTWKLKICIGGCQQWRIMIWCILLLSFFDWGFSIIKSNYYWTNLDNCFECFKLFPFCIIFRSGGFSVSFGPKKAGLFNFCCLQHL